MCRDAIRSVRCAAQRRQADAGGIEAAIDRENLPGDVARAVAAQEEHRLRQFLFEAVAVERDRVVIVGADFRAYEPPSPSRSRPGRARRR